jgi:hypothetical protein
MYLEICPFLLDFPIHVNIGSPSSPGLFHGFLGVCCYLPFLGSDFTNLGFFPPLFSLICQGLVNLVYFLSETTFYFADYLYVFWSLFHQFWPLFD